MFCRVTGFGGTTQVATAIPTQDEILDRKMMIHFNSDVSPNLDWSFAPEKRKISVQVGQQALISFNAENNADHPTAGTAIYNVTPPKAGKYFHKTQCFCFDYQMLPPGEPMDM